MVHELTTFSRIKLAAVAVCALMSSSNLAALGLGALEVQSNLDQPLNGVIELRVAAGDDLSSLQVAIASRQDFDSMGVDYPGYLDDITLRVEEVAGAKVLRVASNGVVINEPFIHLLIRVDWSGGSFLREYTALIDPPVYAAQTPQALAEPRIVGTDESYKTEQAPGIEVDELEAGAVDEVAVDDEVLEAVTAAEDEFDAVDGNADQASGVPAPAAGQTPTDAQYGPVVAGESLGLIAEDLQRQFPDLSIYQIMKVLFEENRAAFIDDNINGLMKGVILNLGDLNAIRAVDIAEGKQFFYKHLNDWDPSGLADSYADGSGLRVAQDEYVFDNNDGGSARSSNVAGQNGGTFQVGASSDTQALVSGAAANNRDGEVVALKQQILELESSLSSSQLENRELAERISLLEGQLGDMNRLISMNVEDADMASLEATLAQQNNAREVDAAVAGLADGSADDPLDADEAQAPALELDEQALDEEVVPDFDEDELAVADGLDADEETLTDDAIQPAAASTVKLYKDPSILDKIKSSVVDGGLWKTLGGFGVVLLGGLGLLLYRRRRADEEFEISMLSIETHSHSVNDGAGTTEEDGASKNRDRETSFLTVYSDSDAVVQADEVDPVAEADVYIAYGRDEQAEEVLLDGIVAKPNRIDIKQKLLSLYHKNNNVEGFERIAEEMYSQKNFLTPEVWQEVSLMGKGIAPKNPLFDVSATEILTGDELVGAAVRPDKTTADARQESDVKDRGGSTAAEPEAEAKPTAAVEPAKVEAADKSNVDFVDPADLMTIEDDTQDMEGESQAVDFALAEDEASINLINFDDGRSEISELDEVDMDALLGDDDAEDDDANEIAEPVARQVGNPDVDADADQDAERELAASGNEQDREIDQQLTDSSPVEGKDAIDEQDNAPVTLKKTAGIDGDSELDEPLEFERIDVPGSADADDFSLTASKEISDLEVDDDYDETRTQYELAKVFVDLGDEDGARKILDDIISGRNSDDEVVADANKLLASINR